MYKQTLPLFLCIFLSACDLIDYHPYDGRLTISERDINDHNIPLIEAATKDKDTIRFVLMGDTQRSYDETEVNILSKLDIPYVGLIGNHDVIGNGDQVFNKLFGEENFSFIVRDVKFVCLNTNAIEYDYSHPVPDFGFLKEELQDSTRHYSRTIVAMHARPGSEQFDNNVKDVFQLYIREFPSLLFCLNAHNHQLQVEDLFDDGIIYYGCSNIAKRNYLLFTLTPDGYTYEIINF